MTPEIFIAVFGVFLAVAVVSGAAASWWLARSAPEQRRLRNFARPKAQFVAESSQSLTEGPDPKLARLTRLIPRSPKDMSRLQRRLAGAGYPAFRSVVWYSLAE